MKYLIAWLKKVIRKIREGRLKELYVQWVWMFQYVRKYWLQVALFTGLNVTGTVLGLLSSVVSRNLVDSVTGHNSGALGLAAGLYVGVGVFQIFTNAIRNHISLRLNLKVSTEIKFDIFKQVIRSDWEALSKYRPGDIQYRLNGDVMIIITNVLTFIPTLVSMLISFFGALGIMLQNDVTMAVITMCGAPVSLLVSRYSLVKMREYQEKNLEFSGTNVSFNQELFQNMQTIKAFGLVDAFIDRFRSMQTQSVRLQLDRNKYQQIGTIMTSFVGQAIGYVCYGFAIYRLWQGQISYGTMTMLVGMAGSLRGSFSSLVNTIPGMIRTGISAGRVMELIDLPREADEESDILKKIHERAKEMGVTVSMHDVTAQYGENKPVYTHANFVARPGEVIGLVGPSGLGKTTTLKLLLGLLHPRCGEVTVRNGKDVEVVSAASRKLFSYIPQSNTIFNGTIADNLKMLREDATEEEMKQALFAASADFVDDLPNGMDEEIFENGQTLSEGQKQRISIARAILADTPVLLLDEATSALDVATENRVLHRMMQYDPLRTVIVTAHRPSVFEMCDRVYKIEGGRFEEIDEEQLQQFLTSDE